MTVRSFARVVARPAAPARVSRLARWRPLTRPGSVVALVVLAVAFAFALFPGLFTGYDPLAGVAAETLKAPSAAHWFGTDATGRDLFSRVVHGARHSLTAGAAAVGIGFVLGTLLGVVAGARPGVVDDAIMRFVDVLLAIPGLLLALSVVILLGFGTTNAAIAVGLTSVAMFARVARSQVVSVSATDYVEAAYGSGGTFWRVLARHVLPNSLGPVLALVALQFGSAILQIATLGFLGYGAPPPTPEWGLLISEGRNYMATAWWLTTLPGVVVVAVVLATNKLSSAIREVTR
ncbi:ABC transporter permease [Tessaracoccus palaemonis]|uniref:ABC transporter permease n=1 Tax=Tessaracoccus palaemonis TaxID=2829499 RepID=A0ABX8SIR2_9ACTN|nr:ABC transporter permease [Tessaracoccus palaemonis]QXT63200.1 ABC transporter permease [Tessaracoccus palaemonis]